MSALNTRNPLLVSKTINLVNGEEEAKREEIRDYFHKTFTLYEKLFEVLARDETYYLRPEPLRHPLIFYYGHTAAFYTNKLVLGKVLNERINQRIESVVAVGVDEMSWDDLDHSTYNWPTVNEVREYRKKVRETVDRLISTMPLRMPITWSSPFWIIMMGIEHERIHLETSSVLIRQLPITEVVTHELWNPCTHWNAAPTGPRNLLELVPGGTVQYAKPRNHSLYGWDNEYGEPEEIEVPDFQASKYLVSNGEFLEFVQDNGYENSCWWTEEGWNWRTFKQAKCPVFWVADTDEDGNTTYKYRSMLEEMDMPWDWPVDVNYLEAKAFCNWKSSKLGKTLRLPTEAEYVRLRDYALGANAPDQDEWKEGSMGNVNLEYYASSCPVDQFVTNGFGDVVGNVWQWTETPIDAFKGFQVHPLYDDFSTPTFDTKHNLIKGGSWISTGNEATFHSRYAFRRHFFQHAGLRYVESDAPIIIKQCTCETGEFAKLLEFHYGSNELNVETFPVQCANLVVKASERHPKGRALELLCGAGRTTFELARHFQEVVGVDVTTNIIKIAHSLRENGTARYAMKSEGEIEIFSEVHLDKFDITEMERNRTEFWQGDPANLKPTWGTFDVIVASRVIERISNPRAMLEGISNFVNKGGLFILGSTYDWNASITPRENWLGGFKKSAENFTSLDGIAEILNPHFTMVHSSVSPKTLHCVIKESKSTFQHNLVEFTVWKRK